jgi:hypothetical protein
MINWWVKIESIRQSEKYPGDLMGIFGTKCGTGEIYRKNNKIPDKILIKYPIPSGLRVKCEIEGSLL